MSHRRLAHSTSRLGMLCLAGPLFGVSAHAEQNCSLKLIAAIPAELQADGKLLLSAAMDGLPTKILLDTGANYSMVSAAVVSALKLPLTHTNATLIGADGSLAVTLTQIDELRLGNGTSRNQKFVVQPLPKHGAKESYSGIFAADYLSLDEVEIDLADGKVNLFSQDHCPGKVVYWDQGAYEFPIDVTRDGHIELDVRIDGERVKAWLDTGAGTSFMTRRVAQSQLDISADELNKGAPIQILGLSGQGVEARSHVFGKIELSSFVLKNWPVVVTDPPSGEARYARGTPDMVIGMDVISRFRMFISYGEGKIYFTPAVAPAPADGAGPKPALDAAGAMDNRSHSVEEMRRLGEIYETGTGVPVDLAQAMKWYRRAADAGDAASQRAVGLLYQHGKGVPVDDAEAMTWFSKAADAGDAVAPSQIGFLYETGGGVPVDYGQAMAWYGKAAEKGNATAETNIGNLYHLGRGIAADDGQAAIWYRKAAEAGYVPGTIALARLYAAGAGVAKDCGEARRWFQKAADGGAAAAKAWLAGNTDCR